MACLTLAGADRPRAPRDIDLLCWPAAQHDVMRRGLIKFGRYLQRLYRCFRSHAGRRSFLDEPSATPQLRPRVWIPYRKGYGQTARDRYNAWSQNVDRSELDSRPPRRCSLCKKQSGEVMFLISSQSRDFCDKCVRAWLRALPRRGFKMFRRHRNPSGRA